MGHVLRMAHPTTDIGIAHHDLDKIPKHKIWTKNYEINHEMTGENTEDCLRLYTDGTKLDGQAGYGSVLLDSDDTVLKDCK